MNRLNGTKIGVQDDATSRERADGMKRIMIADASKASLVMTSEVFKDHFPGVQVVVARTSADAIEAAKNAGELDAFIIDYDLPDRDGAYTASRLKKQFKQPILITAFDRQDVQENIDRELAAFDDCLSWIKKPVKPEMVVSLAQRFIEGKHRCQRRLECSIPAFMEVELSQCAELTAAAASLTVGSSLAVSRVKVVQKKAGVQKGSSKALKTEDSSQKSSSGKATAGKAMTGKAAAGKATTGKAAVGKAATGKAAVGKATTGKAMVGKATTGKATVGKATVGKVTTGKVTTGKATTTHTSKVNELKSSRRKTEPAISVKPVRKIIPILIDDVSLGGLKIRVNNQDLTTVASVKGTSVQLSCTFLEGQILGLFVPPAHVIEAGAAALEKWKKTQSKTLTLESLAAARTGQQTASASSPKSPTLSSNPQMIRNTLSKAVPEPVPSQGHAMQANVRWTSSSESFTFCGLRSEAVNVSKKLFEVMIEVELRTRSQLSPTVSPNTARLSKLNA